MGRPVKTLAIVQAKDKNLNKDYGNGGEKSHALQYCEIYA